MKPIIKILSVCLVALLADFGTCLHSQSVPKPAIIENVVLDAVNKYNERDFDGAIRLLETVVEAESSNDAACYYLSLSYLGKGDAKKAEEYLSRAVEADPKNFWYRYRLANLYSLTSREELTISLYEKLVEDYPRKSELYFDMVELYSSQGEYQKALETLDQVETIFGKNESTTVFRFNLLHKLQKNDEAFACLEEFNKEYSSPYVLSTLAEWQMSMYNDSTALAYYDEALDLAPDYVPAILGKAETLRMTRKYDKFFNVLNQIAALEDYPAAGKSDYIMAIVQHSDPKFLQTFGPQMDSVMNSLIQVHPTDSTILRTSAVYYYSTDRKQKAGAFFSLNKDLWPDSYDINAEYIEYLMYAQQWEELSEQGRKAFGRFPSETVFLEMASVGDYNLKEYDRVLEICHTVLEKAPNDSSATLRAWSTAGDIYHLKGDSKKAYKAYEKALKINPNYVYVLNNYAYYLSIEGKNLKKAYNMSKKTVEAEPDNSTYLDTFGWILFLQGKALEAKPFFKHAMLYGGKESAVVMDHYAEVLYALKEYDLAFVYWNLAKQKNDGSIPDLDERISQRKQAVNK